MVEDIKCIDHELTISKTDSVEMLDGLIDYGDKNQLLSHFQSLLRKNLSSDGKGFTKSQLIEEINKCGDNIFSISKSKKKIEKGKLIQHVINLLSP